MIRAFWYKSKNFGDQLAPYVLEWVLNEPIELASRHEGGKLLAIGSIMTALRINDVVWGAGSIRNSDMKQPEGTTFLAVRGPLTRGLFFKRNIPEIYGDPAILLPLIYKPNIEKKYKFGILPHYIDKDAVKGGHIIDIEQPWRQVVDDILACESVVTSSLHGIIACEAYGIPVTWRKYGDKIIGGEFKFQDYFMGTGRQMQKYERPISPLENLQDKQNILISVLKKHYGKN